MNDSMASATPGPDHCFSELCDGCEDCECECEECVAATELFDEDNDE